MATTAAWAVAVCLFDVLTDTNYGFLVEKPSSGTILDLLGLWPLYVIVEVALIAGVWALMTWPWNRQPQRDAARTFSRNRSGESGVAPRPASQS